MMPGCKPCRVLVSAEQCLNFGVFYIGVLPLFKEVVNIAVILLYKVFITKADEMMLLKKLTIINHL